MAKGQGGPACHSRGTKLPCWRTRHVDKRNEKELEAIKLRKGGQEVHVVITYICLIPETRRTNLIDSGCTYFANTMITT